MENDQTTGEASIPQKKTSRTSKLYNSWHFTFSAVGTGLKFFRSNQFCWAIVIYTWAKTVPFPIPD